ncbi:MAG TPA: hypothetical protein VND94_00840 [Terriglobia bacterium]|nr:hypothetical protein [Terriglobia bacterium]
MSRRLTTADRSFIAKHSRAQRRLLAAPKGEVTVRQLELLQLTTEKLKQEVSNASR